MNQYELDYSSTRTYVGQTNDGNEHGLGYYDVTMQCKSAGQFVNNLAEGRAVKTWIQGETYVGQYKNNAKSGNGVHAWQSGARYVGQFKNNSPDGYGILTTVHNGVKFIGKVSGHIAVPIEGNWYTADNIQIDPLSLGIDAQGCKQTAPGVTVNAIGEIITLTNDTITVNEKNFITTTNLEKTDGERITYHFGDWITRYTGGFRNGRYHGNGLISYHNGTKHNGVFAFGNEVTHDTYTSVATNNLQTRSTQRRLDRNYCMVYDMMLPHYYKIIDDDSQPVIVEFGIGRGDHLIHLKKLFPGACIIAVDNLSPTSIPTTKLEEQQVRDLQVAQDITGIEFYFNTDCYDKQSISNIVKEHGEFDFAIHDASHTTTVWSKLDHIREALYGSTGILITEEFASSAEADDPNSVDWEQVSSAINKGWRVWDLRSLNNFKQPHNSLIGVYVNGEFDGSSLHMYEVNNVSN